MSDIAASERRLAAALDRIDYILENAPARPEPSEAGSVADDSVLRSRLEDARAENARLAAELQVLRDKQGQTLDQALSDTRDRLTGAARETARLAAANDELAAANRALIAAQGSQDGGTAATQSAYEAEIESLRAARAAEIAQMGDLMAELERLLKAGDGTIDGSSAGPDYAEEGETPDMARDPESGFDAVDDDIGDEDLAGSPNEDSEDR